MCKISTGAEIQSMSDIQNLVTGFIFREKYPYNISSITEKILFACDGRSFDIADSEIKKIILQTNMTFLRTQQIYAYNGKYFTKRPY